MITAPGLRVAVTGAGGFIGAAVCRAARAAGAAVVAIGPGATAAPGVTAVPHRIEPGMDLAAYLHGATLLIHAAGHGTPAAIGALHDPVAMEELQLTAIVLEAAARARIGRVVMVSSGGTVYGDPADATPLGEDHALRPRSRYGAVKLLAEEMARTVDRMGMVPCVVARLSNPYGPGQVARRGQGLIAAVAASVWAGEPVQIWGDGHAVRDYVYIDDAARGLLAAGQMPGGTAVNVSSGRGMATHAVVAALLSALAPGHPIRFASERDAGVLCNILDHARLTAATGWVPQVGWAEGLARTVAWWQHVNQFVRVG